MSKNIKTLSQAAVQVLGSMEVMGHEARIGAGVLDRKLYMEVNQALESLGGIWNKKAKAHLFSRDPQDALDQVVLTGRFRRTSEKQQFDIFETPVALADDVVAWADVRAGMHVLEPSCGTGRLIQAALRRCTGLRITAFDAIQVHVDIVGKLPDIFATTMDFLNVSPVQEFDRVIMNPPFSKQADIDHVRHAMQFVKPGGRLVSIMSGGVLFRDNSKTVSFREFISKTGTLRALPDGSFKESGTDVSTAVLIWDR